MLRRLTVAAALAAGVLCLPAPALAIVGGGPATRAYPAMAALSDGEDFLCGASLVAPSWVLTAAHCVADGDRANLRLALGTARLSERSRAEQPAIAEVVVHERYGTPSSSSNDVALLRLASPSARTPIRIPAPAERAVWGPGRQATIIGWGSTTFGDLGATSPDQLHEAQVPMVSDSACRLSYGLTLGFDAATMVCAGELLGARDTCSGDSGGPLMVPDATGTQVLAGVVSFGLGCGYPTQYGVYARVGDTALYGWITARTGVPGAAPPAPVATPPPTAARPARLTVGRVTRRGPRVTVRVSTTAPVRRLRAAIVRVRSGRSATLARVVRGQVRRTATLRLRLRRRSSTRGAIRVALTATDGQGRRVAASRRVRLP